VINSNDEGAMKVQENPGPGTPLFQKPFTKNLKRDGMHT